MDQSGKSPVFTRSAAVLHSRDEPHRMPREQAEWGENRNNTCTNTGDFAMRTARCTIFRHLPVHGLQVIDKQQVKGW